MQLFGGNKIVILLAILIVVIGLLFFVTTENGQQDFDSQESAIDSPTTEEEVEDEKSLTSTKAQNTVPKSVSKQSGATGRLVFAIHSTGNPASEIEALLVPLRSVSIRNIETGWITLLKNPKTYDLLFLNKDRKPELVLDLNVGEGEYDQLRILLGTAIVLKGNIANQVKSLSDELTVPFNLVLEKGKNSAFTLDFIVDKSLHTLIDGTYIFTPVFSVNSQSGISTIQKSGNKVEFFDGTPQFNAVFGVDANGNTKINSSIDTSAVLDLVQDVLVVMPYSLDRTNLDISAGGAIDTVLESKLLIKVTSVLLAVKDKKRVWQVFDESNSASKSVFVDAMTGEILSIE